MTKVFANDDFKKYKAAVENKKAVLFICKTNKTLFGLLIVNPIIFSQLSIGPLNSSLVYAFNIAKRMEFKGNGEVRGWDYGYWGQVWIGSGEVGIRVWGKKNYEAYFLSGRQILHITKDGKGVNAIH